ncbi:hypothetical protein VE00_06933 [Pseudogymnoascus sp. WSF 3629]|nr:hypothetical protein VE00_06933 [Pseudogymnoascus sp. WSF 3629]
MQLASLLTIATLFLSATVMADDCYKVGHFGYGRYCSSGKCNDGYKPLENRFCDMKAACCNT